MCSDQFGQQDHAFLRHCVFRFRFRFRLRLSIGGRVRVSFFGSVRVRVRFGLGPGTHLDLKTLLKGTHDHGEINEECKPDFLLSWFYYFPVS